MRVCSTCFRGCRTVGAVEQSPDVTAVTVDSLIFDNSRIPHRSPTVFYCCGTVPPVGIYRKRHGMDASTILNKDATEVAMEVLESKNYGITRIKEPGVPYVAEIPEQLYQGRAIEIRGRVLPKASSFSINLSAGPQSDSDLGLHFNPRFDRRIVVRNHRLRKKWGSEEIVTVHPFPFALGKSFSVLLFIADEQFMIMVNHVHFCTFGFRFLLDRITHIAATGDIQLMQICHCDMTCYPPLISSRIPSVVIPRIMKKSGVKCVIRRKTKAIAVGTKINLIGRLKMLPTAFYINLQSDSELWPHPVIPFHMNIRFHQPDTWKREQETIFNSWMNGSWGSEEITAHCPFSPGSSFNITISCLEKSYYVKVNDMLLFDYKRRSEADVNALIVHGDIIITKVSFR